MTARFTTIDPIRDGTNWFPYVNNDPVNHIDLWGLCEVTDNTNNNLSDYKKKLNIEDYYIPDGNKNRPGDELVNVKAVVLHWTEVPNQTPEETIDYWTNEGQKGKSGKYGSAQYVIGTEGRIVQAMPENEVAWHSGQNLNFNYPYTPLAKSLLTENIETVNYFCIGIEMEPLNKQGEFSKQTVDSATQLTAIVMLEHKLNPDKDLLRHYDLTTKPCPLYYVDDKKWENFKNGVKIEMEKLGGIGYEK